MTFLLANEQNMLRESARDFLASESPISHFRAMRDERPEAGLSRELWKKFAEVGFSGLPISEQHGGSGLGHVEMSILMQEIGRNLSPTPFWSTAVVCANALGSEGSPEQQALYLPLIASGDIVVALALEEGPKHEPSLTSLAAQRSPDGFLLDGMKVFVTEGLAADWFLVVARTGSAPPDTYGITLFLVARSSPGVSVEPVFLVDGRPVARLRMSKVFVSASAIVGRVDEGWKPLSVALSAGRLGAAAELLGVASRAFELTLAYLKERVQFGRFIGEFQALQHRAARVHGQIALARAGVEKAAWLLDTNTVVEESAAGEADAMAAARAVHVAKAKSGDAARLAVQEAVQMHGGMGMTDDVDVGLYMKRARVLDELLGDSRYHASQLAAITGY